MEEAMMRGVGRAWWEWRACGSSKVVEEDARKKGRDREEKKRRSDPILKSAQEGGSRTNMAAKRPRVPVELRDIMFEKDSRIVSDSSEWRNASFLRKERKSD